MSKEKAHIVNNTRATVLHPALKLKNQVFHAEMQHPLHGRLVKVFRADVVNFHPLRHADAEVYYFKDKGSRYTVDMILWLRYALTGAHNRKTLKAHQTNHESQTDH